MILRGSLIGCLIGYVMPPIIPQILNIIVPLNESRPRDLPFPVYYFVDYSEDHFYWVVTHLDDFEIAFKFGIFLIASSTNLLVHNVFSQRLMDHSTEITDTIYNISWDELQLSVRKNFLFIMMRCRIPCKMTAGKMLDLSYRTATAVRIRFCGSIKALYLPCFMFLVTLNGIFISASLIQIVAHSNNFIVTVKYCAFVGNSVAHLFFNTLFTQRIRDYSTGLTDTVYNSLWYEKPSGIRKILLLIMLRSKIPCDISAVKLLNISLRSACWVRIFKNL
ncbi:uncharacterized protein LOC122498385 [Leptopilina heterotoma]|uniref:uncharacterized protein LOC122498385 n=1 Tax=Leptopilina heterotoma TaxID=63436 RepID=UPI001CA852F8|nr:uncharacterized protein LOC122498385 [Leptopilina heterotoma]